MTYIALKILVGQTKGWELDAASMPAWLKWGFWVCPLSYGEIGLAVNEFHAPRWNKVEHKNPYFIKNNLIYYSMACYSFLKLRQMRR